MAAIRFEVWWSDTSREILTCDLDERVSNIIELLRQQVGTPLPEEDNQGHLIEYALYRDDRGQRVAIQRRLPLAQASIRHDDQLYLANRKAPWWQPAPILKSIRNSDSDDDRNIVSATFIHCRLQLAPGCAVDVPPEGMNLDRNYLFAKLPRSVVAWENAKILLRRGSPLLRVSREPHCKFFRSDEGWMLRVYKPTYINGKRLQKGSVVALLKSTTIILGSDGWRVEVQLDAR